MKDPLDHKIDALLATRPLRPSDDFSARVLDAVEADEAARGKRPFGKLPAFALPLAAAVVLTLSLLRWGDESQTRPAETSAGGAALTTAEAREIFLWEESLAGLAAADASGFAGQDLLATLDALYLEI